MRLFKRCVQLFGVILLVISGALALARRAEAQPQFVLFTRTNTPTLEDIYRVRYDSSAIKQLTAFPGQEDLMWEVEDGWFYFVRAKVGLNGEYTLYRMRLNGQHPEVVLRTPERLYLLGIDNGWLYTQSGLDYPPNIIRQRLDGSARQVIAPPTENYVVIAYGENNESFTYWSDDAGGGDIYWATMDGSTIRQITYQGNVAQYPTAIVNGWLYYHTEVEFEGEPLRSFYRIPTEGGTPEFIDENVSPLWSVDYSGDEARLLYSTYRSADPLVTEAHLLNLTTLEKQHLIRLDGEAYIHHWLAGGEWVYYTLQTSDQMITPGPLARLNLQTGESQIIVDAYADFYVMPSPDPNWLVVASIYPERQYTDLYRIRPDGSEPTLMATNIRSSLNFTNRETPDAVIYAAMQNGTLELYNLDLTIFRATKLTTGGNSSQFDYANVTVPPPVEMRWGNPLWLGILGAALLVLPALNQWRVRAIRKQPIFPTGLVENSRLFRPIKPTWYIN